MTEPAQTGSGLTYGQTIRKLRRAQRLGVCRVEGRGIKPGCYCFAGRSLGWGMGLDIL